jgi:hypothetical protein
LEMIDTMALLRHLFGIAGGLEVPGAAIPGRAEARGVVAVAGVRLIPSSPLSRGERCTADAGIGYSRGELIICD